MFKSIIVSIVAILLLVTGCSFKGYNFRSNQPEFNKTYANNLTKISFSRVPRWESQNFYKSFEIFKKSCKGNIDEKFNDACEEVDDYRISEAKQFFENNFTPYLLSNNNGSQKGRITGYYESRAFGSIVKTDKFKYPIYATPNTRYSRTLSRKRINKRIINARVICYLDNRYDRYQLHLQGSGTIYLKGGGIIKLGYANNNGMAFKGGITEALKLAVTNEYKTYNRVNAEKFARKFEDSADKIYNKYSRYIFFKEQNRKNSVGRAGVELTPEYSIAVDQRYIPMGTPVMLYSYNDGMDQYISRMMFAHDTGNAIKGHVRADIYYGAGIKAKNRAMGMNNKGSMIILIPLKMHKEIERIQAKSYLFAMNQKTTDKRITQIAEVEKPTYRNIKPIKKEPIPQKEEYYEEVFIEDKSTETEINMQIDRNILYELPDLEPIF